MAGPAVLGEAGGSDRPRRGRRRRRPAAARPPRTSRGWRRSSSRARCAAPRRGCSRRAAVATSSPRHQAAASSGLSSASILPPGNTKVARGELALEVAAHQQALDAAAGAIAKEHQRRGGRRCDGRRFDGHGVVCHDARAVVILLGEARHERRSTAQGQAASRCRTPTDAAGQLRGRRAHRQPALPVRPRTAAPEGKATARGKVGRDLTVEQGYQVAREVGLNLLATDARRRSAASTA